MQFKRSYSKAFILPPYIVLIYFLNFINYPTSLGFPFLVTIYRGFHPFPSRTRPLSPE
ncbi:MAG: hypothetical protein RLZZ129_1950 [Verrucomicrobiota bacterium]